MKSKSKVSILLLIITSISLWGDFSRDNSGGVVLDNESKLEWQDSYMDSKIERYTWQNALVYCEELTLNGSSDWRLPNMKELKSIVDDSVADPSLFSVFQSNASFDYWSSTTSLYASDYAWYVTFSTGFDFWANKSSTRNNVRCVRGGVGSSI